MSSVVDFAQYLNSAIQAGSAVEGTAVKVIADNGAEIGDAVFKVIQGGNGTAAEVGVATQTGAGGIVATGLAYLTMSLPEVALAIAPALGIAGGVGLYNLAPEFWTDVSEALVNAGQTIGGKVLAFWDGLNLNLDAKTIEILKRAFVNYGVFDINGTIEEQPEAFPEELEALIPFYSTGTHFYEQISEQTIYDVYSIDPNYSHIERAGAFVYWSGNRWNLIAITVYNSPVGNAFTFDNRTVYYNYTLSNNTVEILSPYNEITSDLYNVIRTNAEYVAWLLKYNYNTTEILPLQEDATYPNQDPFNVTYPTWEIHIYPPTLPDITILPQVYPLAYPEIDPGITQDPAQNPDPEPVPVVIPIIIPKFPLPEPGSGEEPEPGPEPDPDPEPVPEPIPEDGPVNPDPDPTDPNIPPTPSVPIVIPPLPNTVDSNKLFTVYNPSSSQLDALGGYLWDSSIIAAIRDIWQEPMDGLISLQQVYVTPVTGGSHNIILGFLDSGVSAPVVSQQFVEVNCGSVDVPENKKNATDYAPYTSLHLYLPFIGIVELDTNECMKSTISVKYKVDVYTGTCLATVSVDREEDMPNDPILYTFSGNCSQQLPLTSGNATGMLGALVGAISTGLSVASGGGLSTLAGAQLLGNSLTHEMMHVSHSGNISANAGIMGQKKPYLIIGRRHCYDANDYNSYYGFPANKTVVLGNHTGFCRVKSAWIKTSALQEEYNQIMELLENGVFI